MSGYFLRLGGGQPVTLEQLLRRFGAFVWALL
jgi:hypothetical protein